VAIRSFGCLTLRLFHAASIWARDSGHVSAAYMAICSTSAEVGDIIGWMAIDDPGLRARRSTLGYAMVLLCSVLFVASCFLPYLAVLSLSTRTLSLYQQLTLGPYGGFSELGTVLFLFGGVVPVAPSRLSPSCSAGERRFCHTCWWARS
jgi:hypothetical protein